MRTHGICSLAALTAALCSFGCGTATVNTVTAADFGTVVKRSGPVAVFFTAEWCESCTEVGLLLNSMAAQYGGRLAIYQFDCDSDQELIKAEAVDAIPQVRVYRGGRLVHRIVGSRGGEWLEKELDRALAGTGDPRLPSPACTCGCTHSPECCLALPEPAARPEDPGLPPIPRTPTAPTADDVVIPDFGPPVPRCRCAGKAPGFVERPGSGTRAR